MSKNDIVIPARDLRVGDRVNFYGRFVAEVVPTQWSWRKTLVRLHGDDQPHVIEGRCLLSVTR